MCCKCKKDYCTCVSHDETITCERYAEVILGQFFPEFTEEERLYGWFQQDSATAHTSCITMQTLSDIFGDDYQRWYLKDKVYNNYPRTEEELKENVRREWQIFLQNSFRG
jgi:hypothetical protein